MRIQRLRAVAWKEFIEIRRDPRTLALAVLMPILLLIIFGYAITLDIREIPVALCDRDRTAGSRELARAFFASGYFRLVEADACGRGDEILSRGTARLFLEIPRRFEADFQAGRRPSVQVLIDGADNNTASVAAGYVEPILRDFRRDPPRGRETPAEVRLASRIWFNPDMESTVFITPGVIGMLIMIIGVALPAMAIVRERELGNLERLSVTPVRPAELILGKMLPYGAISFGVIVLILIASVAILGVPYRGSTVHLFGQTVVFLVATLGMGLLISTLAKTRSVAYFISLLTTLLPTFILSGFIFPVESMPVPLQAVSQLIPTTHFLVILRAILLKGVGPGAVWAHTAALTGFGLVVISISIRRFRGRIA